MTDRTRMFVYPGDVDAFGFDWGKLSLTVAPEVNGAARFSGGVVDLPPGQGHARHNHPGAEEIIFVISGNGEQMIEDEMGNPIVRQVGPGCTCYIPENRFPSTLNTSSAVFSCRTSRWLSRELSPPARMEARIRSGYMSGFPVAGIP